MVKRLDNAYAVYAANGEATLTVGYYIDLEAAKVMYNLTNKIYVVADEWSYFQNFVSIYTLNLPIVKQDPKYGSIIWEIEPDTSGKQNIKAYFKKNKLKSFVKKLIPYGIIEYRKRK